jgi:hypothetical protein
MITDAMAMGVVLDPVSLQQGHDDGRRAAKPDVGAARDPIAYVVGYLDGMSDRHEAVGAEHSRL